MPMEKKVKDKAPPLDYAGLGRRLRDARMEKGYSQEELGELAGIGATHVSYIERNIRKVSLEALYKLSVILGVTIDELLRPELYDEWVYGGKAFLKLVGYCTRAEVRIIYDTSIAVLNSLRKNKDKE